MKGIALNDTGYDQSTKPDMSQPHPVKTSSDILELSKHYPLFSEDEDRLRNDLRESDINSTALRYEEILNYHFTISKCFCQG